MWITHPTLTENISCATHFPYLRWYILFYRKFEFSETFPPLDIQKPKQREGDFKSADEVKKEQNNEVSIKSEEKLSSEKLEFQCEKERVIEDNMIKDCFDFENEEKQHCHFNSSFDPKQKSEKKTKKNFTKGFKCDQCEKKYTWYTGLSNHKRFVHNKHKET